MSLQPVGHFPNQPAYFDHPTAEVVYGFISKMDDDTAEMLADLIVGELHQGYLAEHEDEVGKALGAYLDTHGAKLREALTRSYVSKRATDGDISGVVAAAELVSKDWTGASFSAESRAERARKQHRDLVSGEFVKQHHDIGYDTISDDGKRLKPADDRTAQRMYGIPAPAEELTASQKLAYQQAYAQVQAVLSGHQRNPEGKFLHLHYAGREPELHPLPGRGEALPLTPNKRLQAVSLSEIPAHKDLDTYDTYGNVRDAVAHSYPTGVGEGGENAGVQRIRSLDRDLRPDPFAPPGSRTFTRLGASSRFLDESFKDKDGNSVLPRRVQAGLKAGQVVGLYGPEAAKVIGPAADKTAYRYRGTERPADRKLLISMESLRRDPSLKTPEDRRELAIHGRETGDPQNPWQPSGVLSYFRGRLPNAQLNTLQRKSGTIPPSEGVILDAKGRIVTQAVGYGDDHYLPFNLGKLRGLRGGEYIRTRTWGGPTTEDIYTGLISGAQGLTVVSHNGAYTVEFEKGFTGKRRYNDKAARMVARYGYLLDAVKNGEITTGQIDSSRIREIQESAAAAYDPDLEPEQFRNETERLMARERRTPTFSTEQRQAAAADFLDTQAMNYKTPDGHEMTRGEMVDNWLSRQAKGDESFKREIATRSGLTSADPAQFNESAIRAMGLNDKYGQFLRRQEDDYRAQLKPLELNGPGYQLALEALQEQFPYYIKSVEFHPWANAQGGRDTGYVNPKQNRPAAVLAGYFDRSINGSGKVHANTVRGQADEVRPYQTPAARAASSVREGVASLSGANRRQEASLSTSDARELRVGSDRSMLSEIKRRTRFGGAFHGAGVSGLENATGARGEEVGGYVANGDVAKMSPDLAEIWEKPESEFLRMQETPEGADRLHDKLKRAIDAIEKHSAVELNDEVVRRFREEGKSPVAKPFNKAEVGPNLRAVDSEHDFGSRTYDKAQNPSSTDVEQVFRGHEGIRNIVPRDAMGEPYTVDLFDTEAQNSVKDTLEKRHAAVLAWRANGGHAVAKPTGADRLPADVEALVRAKQLRRRWEEDEARNVEPVEPTAGLGFVGGGVHRIEVVMPSGAVMTPISDQQVNDQFNGLAQFNGLS